MEIADGIYAFQGARNGKNILILGGTHGNEETGVAVVAALQRELADTELQSGTIRLAIGNPRAVAQGKRFSMDGTDLNKLFRKEILEGKRDAYEVERAQLLAPYISDSDIVIDIHSTQQQTATAFISSAIDEEHESVYRWFRTLAPIVIEDPNYIFAGEPASIDEYADTLGKVGICLETGYAKDVSKVESVTACVRDLLRAVGMLAGTPTSSPVEPFECYRWQESIAYDEREGWRWAPGIIVQSFEYFPRDTVFGFRGDKPVSRPYDSYLLFPKTDELMQIEGRVGYLAVPIR